MTQGRLEEIFNKTGGHCHFCGDPLSLKSRGSVGRKGKPAGPGWRKGYWEVDHVARRSQLGTQSGERDRNRTSNLLPACTGCNQIRRNHKGGSLRRIILLGLIARDEIEKHEQNKPTEVGRQLKELRGARRKANSLKALKALKAKLT